MVEPVTINLRFLARDLDLPQEQVHAVVTLLDEGCPVPFIARYRKDKTDNLDENSIRAIADHLKTVRSFCERKQAILTKIDSLGLLTPELDKKIRDAKKPRYLEDLYLPFRPKRRAADAEARERGLEPLASEILEGNLAPEVLDSRAAEFVDDDKKIRSAADALLGAGQIIAEIFSEKIEVLQAVRDFAHRHGKLVTSKVESPNAPPTAVAKKAVDKKEKGGKPQPAAKEKPKNEDRKPASAVVVESPTVPETAVVVVPLVMSESIAMAGIVPEGFATDSIVTDSFVPDGIVTDGIVTDDIATTDIAETPADSSGSGGGEEVPESSEPVPAPEAVSETVEPETAVIPESHLEPVAEPIGEPEKNVPEPPTGVDTSGDSPAPEPVADSLDGVQDVNEQFQQWKETQGEKGIPTVTSQNTLRKKKKKEAKKRKAEEKERQRAHFERQFHEYFACSYGLRNIPPYRVMAINRGERVRVLKAKIELDEEKIFEAVREIVIPADHPHAEFLAGCLKDALKKRVIPAIEREIRNDLTESAERQSIKGVAHGLRDRLLQPPLDRKRVLALDPGFRHGCKVVPLDEFGNVLDFDTVYLHGNAERRGLAVQKIAEMIRKYNITIIAIGSGPGHRETEEAVSKMIAAEFAETDLAYILVNGTGVGVYSSSPIAKEEFPNYDIMLRGAVSIGRRLQNPLTELVKIEPGSLVGGAYQHDLKNKYLKDALVETVESCVNFVGVDLNSATPALLKHVSGLNPLTAARIYEYRKQNGPFRKREDLKKVPGLGEAAYTYAAGFLRIPAGENPLDATWIHPDHYETAAKILEKLGFSVEDLRDAEKAKTVAAKITEEKVGELASRFASELGIGLFAVRDILENLLEPGRDSRKTLPKPVLRRGTLRMEDLTPGMELTGTVQSIVDFGAFVDIGLHDSGLVHISQMSDTYIRDAHEKVSVGDMVRVWVVEADPKRRRISLTMLPPGTEKQPRGEGRRGRQGDRGDQGDRPPRERSERPPRQGDRKPAEGSQNRGERGEGRRDGGQRRDRNAHRDGARRDGGRRDNRDRGPRTFVAAPKEKEVKPISDEMKKGKEPLRSFGDLAQLLGRVQVPDPEEEKRKKKEEERRRKEKERQRQEQEEKDRAAKAGTEQPTGEAADAAAESVENPPAENASSAEGEASS